MSNQNISNIINKLFDCKLESIHYPLNGISVKNENNQILIYNKSILGETSIISKQPIIDLLDFYINKTPDGFLYTIIMDKKLLKETKDLYEKIYSLEKERLNFHINKELIDKKLSLDFLTQKIDIDYNNLKIIYDSEYETYNFILNLNKDLEERLLIVLFPKEIQVYNLEKNELNSYLFDEEFDAHIIPNKLTDNLFNLITAINENSIYNYEDEDYRRLHFYLFCC